MAQLRHWLQLKGHGTGGLRRAAVVHTSEEIENRLRWLSEPARLDDYFVRFIRTNLDKELERMGCPREEIDSLLRGQIPELGSTHLSVAPRGFVANRGQDIVDLVTAFAAAALHQVFTGMERPHVIDGQPVDFDVALYVRDENHERWAVDLPRIAPGLLRFFHGESDSATESAGCWQVIDERFAAVFGKDPRRLAFKRLNLRPEELIRNVEPDQYR